MGQRVLDPHEELNEECAENAPHPAKIARIYYKPTQEEIHEHEVAHPWRAWCSCSVRGAVVNECHYRVPDRKLTRPTVVIDYSFLASSGQFNASAQYERSYD